VGQDTVVIEEADPKNMEHLADRLKVWADRYPFPGEIKGGRIEGSDHSRSLSPVTIHQRNVSRVQATWNQSLDGSRWYALDLSYLISLPRFNI